MIFRLVAAIALVMALRSNVFAQATVGTPVTGAQQRQIELLAAKAVSPLLAKETEFHAGEGVALDPRLYIAWYFDLYPRDEKNYGPPTSEVSESHTPEHLGELGQVFGIKHIVNDKTACIVETVQRCRIGDYSGVVAFSPVIMRRDTALVAINYTVPVNSKRDEQMIGVHGFTVSLVRDGDSWKVVHIDWSGRSE